MGGSWLKFILGIWILISPWILGYWRITSALWNQIIIGVLIILLFLWEVVGTEEKQKNKINEGS